MNKSAVVFGPTKQKALYVARGLLQRYGFNGFSFQHIADLLGIRKPSLFDHFVSKEVLGQELAKDYYESFSQWSETIQNFSPDEKLEAFFHIFFEFSSHSTKLCPMSALIADFHSLSGAMRKSVLKMYSNQFAWLQAVIKQGQNEGSFRRDISSKELASVVISIAIGSQFSARVLNQPNVIQKLKNQVLDFLCA